MNHMDDILELVGMAEVRRRAEAYPALVAACRAAYDLDIAQDAYDTDDLFAAKEVFAAWGLSSLDPEDALHELRTQVSTLLRDALAAAGEEPQAMSDPLPLLDGTIREEENN